MARVPRSLAGHRPLGRFVLRAPTLPFATVTALGGEDIAVARRALARVVGEPHIAEALFVASPELEAQRLRAPDDPATARAELRYVTRMATRATPFGLFAGVAAGTLGPTTALVLGPPTAHRRHTRLDNDYVFRLCAHLAGDPALRDVLRFALNTSAYRLGDSWRYAECRVRTGARSYHLVQLDATTELDAVLARAAGGAATLPELAAVLTTDPTLTRAEIDAFLDELIAVQILVPTLQPPVTGDEPLATVTAQLAELAPTVALADVLRTVARELAALDASPGGSTAPYRALADALTALPIPVERAKLFQVDLELAAPALTIGPRVVAAAERAVALLRAVAPAPPRGPWRTFCDAFTARYDTREVPLVEALDQDLGIGFADDADLAAAPLLAGLAFPDRGAPAAIEPTPRDAQLRALYTRAIAAGTHAVELDERDLDGLAATTPPALGDSFIVGSTLIAASTAAVDAGDFQLRIEHVTAASATAALGRFCHVSPALRAIVDEVTTHEAACAPDAIDAEIVHLPDGRIGNVLLRPVLRGYEIPYLGASGIDHAHQLPVTDLLVSVRNGRVTLRSRALGKVVRPMLATAHMATRGLAIYRFLAGHAVHGRASLRWDWGPLADAPFLPRVTHRELVLTRARWRIERDELAAGITAVRARRGLPRWIVLAEHDNELVVDLDSALAVDMFDALVRARAAIEVVELLPTPEQLCVTGDGDRGGFAHELLIPFVRDPDSPPERARPAVRATGPRRFPPGSRWLYAKLYGGQVAAETVLRDAVGPLVGEARELGIEGWHFVRYADPDPHLRVRFAGDPAIVNGALAARLTSIAGETIDAGLCWRVQLDTYEREVERYGGDHGIVLAERLFTADSDASLAIIETTPRDDGATARWQLALRGIDRLLAAFALPLDARLALITRVRDRFGVEHGLDTALQRQLGDTFRTHRAAIAELLGLPDDAGDSDHPLAPGIAALGARTDALRPIAHDLRAAEAAGQLAQPIEALLDSYIHMHVNRMLTAAHRRQELVLYDLLRRHYDSVRARSR